jgi:hypothetical protein
MMARALGVLTLGICGSLGLVQPAMAEEQPRKDDVAKVEAAAGDGEEGGGFFDFLKNLDVQPPRVPRSDGGGDGGGGGGGDSGGSGGHN